MESSSELVDSRELAGLIVAAITDGSDQAVCSQANPSILIAPLRQHLL
jgi:hypothetical protein